MVKYSWSESRTPQTGASSPVLESADDPNIKSFLITHTTTPRPIGKPGLGKRLNSWLNRGLHTWINRERSSTPRERRVFPVKYFRFSSLEIWDIPFSTPRHRKWAADCTHLTSCQACWCREKDTRREKYYSWQSHVGSNSQPHVSRWRKGWLFSLINLRRSDVLPLLACYEPTASRKDPSLRQVVLKQPWHKAAQLILNVFCSWRTLCAYISFIRCFYKGEAVE